MSAEIYKNRLQYCLAHNARMNAHQVNTLVSRFESLANQSGDRMKAFRGILSEYGNEDVDQACAGIRDELERLNRTHKGIDVNPVTRIRDYIKRFNEKVDQCAVEVSGIENLDPERIEKLKQVAKLKVPLFAQETKSFTALANYQGRTAQLEIEVKL